MSLFKKSKKNRVCVIGLDGVPYSLVKDLTDRDVMPAFSRLIHSGSLQTMKASLPEISSVSWSDFMTGKNSGTHGIYGFTDFKENSYDLRFPNFSDMKTDTFWDKLGAKKKKSIIVNQPSTYPARHIANGTLISGFVALDLGKAVFPKTLDSALRRMEYAIDIDTLKSREDPGFLWKELEKTLIGREKAFDFLWTQTWDYFELVFTGTDRLHHFLWSAYADESHEYHQKFLDYYNRIDRVIDKISAAFQKETGSLDGLFLLSDHGFTGIEQEIYLNVWLEKEGYLSFRTDSPDSLSQIDPASKAFALDPSRIYLHEKGRFPNGSVEPSDKNSLKQDIAAKLLELDYQEKKVIRRVFDAQDIYSGLQSLKGPDLVVLSEYGFDLKGSVKKKEIFGRSGLEGMHTWDDAFFCSAGTQRNDPDLAISDLADIFMSKLG